nr:MAG TPA: Rad50 zinc hook motif [Bacteriophage sp.]
MKTKAKENRHNMAKIKWTQIICPKCKRNLLKVNPEQAEF